MENPEWIRHDYHSLKSNSWIIRSSVQNFIQLLNARTFIASTKNIPLIVLVHADRRSPILSVHLLACVLQFGMFPLAVVQIIQCNKSIRIWQCRLIKRNQRHWAWNSLMHPHGLNCIFDELHTLQICLQHHCMSVHTSQIHSRATIKKSNVYTELCIFLLSEKNNTASTYIQCWKWDFVSDTNKKKSTPQESPFLLAFRQNGGKSNAMHHPRSVQSNAEGGRSFASALINTCDMGGRVGL